MTGVRPCPYCGGEVEMVKLVKNAKEIAENRPQPYRIECRKCRALVARGQGFPIESMIEIRERIKQYNEHIENKFFPAGWGHKQVGGMPKYGNHDSQ